MQKHLFVFLLLSTVSCSDNINKCQTENGIGKLRLGMTIDQFNNEFPNSKIDSSFDWTEPLKSLTVAKNVILNVGVRFIDGKLASISTESTKQLLDLLKLQNGIARNEDHGKLKVTIFNSKSENIMIVKENEFIGFIDKSLMRKLHE